MKINNMKQNLQSKVINFTIILWIERLIINSYLCHSHGNCNGQLVELYWLKKNDFVQPLWLTWTHPPRRLLKIQHRFDVESYGV